MRDGLSTPQYVAMLDRRREAANQIADGLREYLTAELDAELQEIEAQQQPERRAEIISHLTEALMAASSKVEAVELQRAALQEVFNNLPPDTVELFKPFAPMINGVLFPLLTQLFQKQYAAAVRARDEIQAELMEYEEEQPS
jgi:uncharacterized protein (DUF2164 family)